MKTSRQMIYLKDYQATPYQILHVDLDFDLFPEHTEVRSLLQVKRRAGVVAKTPLVLDGRKLELKKVSINGQQLEPSTYTASESELTLTQVPEEFTLEIITWIRPHLNTALEGLYMSEGMYCTQCEATGFRGITYFYDRPDVMVSFKVRVCADKEQFPVLLSNGNFIAKGDLAGGRHWSVWEDPFPKPCYLFALVAGKLGVREDSFISRSGKKIRLAIYADAKDIDKCDFAMLSLKQAMKWDEDAYGRECDLDDYKVVAVRDFNMGAMENKGLNIFNSSLILASQQTTTDDAFQRIASVIAHEYFHNWTGNRITCRDWFQLCLKEGLTVFREQEFSQAIGSAAVERIDQVNHLKASQFPEDDGPTAHPPRPDRFIEINNFYTRTIYEKGAEVVRVLKTLLGPELFRKGMDLYFERHDGQAVTQEDFVQAFADVSGRDLSQFMLWYTQAGAPHVKVREHYDAEAQKYTLHLEQTVAPTPTEATKKPFHIPVCISLFQSSGKPFDLYLENKLESYGDECTLELKEEKQSFTFSKIKSKPIASLFRHFSAPVRLKTKSTTHELLFLMKHESDPINAWDAGQKLMLQEFLRIIDTLKSGDESASVSKDWKDAFGYFLRKKHADRSFHAKMLSSPYYEIIAQNMEVIDPTLIIRTKQILKQSLAKEYHDDLLNLYKDNADNGHFSMDAEAIGRRLLKNLCLSYLSGLNTPAILDLVLNQYQHANNMTDRFTSLFLLSNWDTPERSRILDHFYANWQHEDLMIDHWFSVQARSELPGTFEDVLTLTKHQAFKMQNPNRMRSLIFNFCKGNPLHFHHAGGQGYKFCADKVIEIDPANRQMSAALVRSFAQWRRFDASRQDLMKEQLERIRHQKGLSSDVFELVTQILS